MAGAFRALVFLRAGAFLAVVFRAVDFRAVDLRAVDVRALDFLAGVRLAAVAAVPIAWVTYIFGYLLPRDHKVGGWVAQSARWFQGSEALFGLAVLVGVAVASGMARPYAGRHGPPPQMKGPREAETYSF